MEMVSKANVARRVKGCVDFLRWSSNLRSITFNCDTAAYCGEHCEKAVELFALALRDVVLEERDKGVRVKLINTDRCNTNRLCLKIFRDGGWKGGE